MTFETEEAAAAALSANGTEVDSRPIRVELESRIPSGARRARKAAAPAAAPAATRAPRAPRAVQVCGATVLCPSPCACTASTCLLFVTPSPFMSLVSCLMCA